MNSFWATVKNTSVCLSKSWNHDCYEARLSCCCAASRVQLLFLLFLSGYHVPNVAHIYQTRIQTVVKDPGPKRQNSDRLLATALNDVPNTPLFQGFCFWKECGHVKEGWKTESLCLCSFCWSFHWLVQGREKGPKTRKVALQPSFFRNEPKVHRHFQPVMNPCPVVPLTEGTTPKTKSWVFVKSFFLFPMIGGNKVWHFCTHLSYRFLWITFMPQNQDYFNLASLSVYELDTSVTFSPRPIPCPFLQFTIPC